MADADGGPVIEPAEKPGADMKRASDNDSTTTVTKRPKAATGSRQEVIDDVADLMRNGADHDEIWAVLFKYRVGGTSYTLSDADYKRNAIAWKDMYFNAARQSGVKVTTFIPDRVYEAAASSRREACDSRAMFCVTKSWQECEALLERSTRQLQDLVQQRVCDRAGIYTLWVLLEFFTGRRPVELTKKASFQPVAGYHHVMCVRDLAKGNCPDWHPVPTLCPASLCLDGINHFREVISRDTFARDGAVNDNTRGRYAKEIFGDPATKYNYIRGLYAEIALRMRTTIHTAVQEMEEAPDGVDPFEMQTRDTIKIYETCCDAEFRRRALGHDSRRTQADSYQFVIKP